MSVKLHSNGKVILKDGKVSCSCCGCCMYPAVAFDDGDIVAADLPATLLINVTGSLTNEVFSKSGTAPIYYQKTISGTDWRIVHNSDGISSTWGLEFYDSFLTLWEGVWASECLIDGDGNFTPGDDTVEDQFAGEYALTSTVGGAFTLPGCACGTVSFSVSGSSSWQLYRSSLCFWESNDIDVYCVNSSIPPPDPCNSGYVVTGKWRLFFDGTPYSSYLVFTASSYSMLVDSGINTTSPGVLDFGSGHFTVR